MQTMVLFMFAWAENCAVLIELTYRLFQVYLLISFVCPVTACRAICNDENENGWAKTGGILNIHRQNPYLP